MANDAADDDGSGAHDDDDSLHNNAFALVQCE